MRLATLAAALAVTAALTTSHASAAWARAWEKTWTVAAKPVVHGNTNDSDGRTLPAHKTPPRRAPRTPGPADAVAPRRARGAIVSTDVRGGCRSKPRAAPRR